MSDDTSKYYKIKLFDPAGAEISKMTLRVYPEDEQGKKMAEMQGAMLGQSCGIFALRHATGGK